MRSEACSDGLVNLRKDGRLLADVHHSRILQLLHVTKAAGQPLWIYEAFDGVSLERVLHVLGARGEHLPIRTGLDLASATVEALCAALGTAVPSGDGSEPGMRFAHPGPAPSEVLIDTEGTVKVAGFRISRQGLVPGGPAAFVPPERQDPEADVVYGVGALMVQALSGECPAEGSEDSARHGSIVRRAMIRVLARPGEGVPDEVIQLIRDCLSIDLTTRPGLGQVAQRLVELKELVSDAQLVDWAPVKVAQMLQLKESGYPSEEDTRQRRYVDPTSLESDEASFEVPPIRSSPLRESPTLLTHAGEGLAVAVGATQQDAAAQEARIRVTGETESARLAPGHRNTGDHSISLPLPESGAPASLGAVSVGIDSAPQEPAAEVSLDIQGSDWEELSSPTQARKSAGWIMVVGTLAGMVTASFLAWIAVDRAGPNLFGPDPAPQTLRVGRIEKGAAADTIADASNIPDAPVPAPVTLDASVEETVKQMKAADPATLPPVAEPVTPSTPPPAKREPVAPVRPVRSTDRFPVTFKSGDPSVSRLTVECHVGQGSGSGVVKIKNAGPGPCRVTGYTATGKLVVNSVLTGKRTFTCFGGGRRVCE